MNKETNTEYLTVVKIAARYKRERNEALKRVATERGAHMITMAALSSVGGVLQTKASHAPACLSREPGCNCTCWLGDAGLIVSKVCGAA